MELVLRISAFGKSFLNMCLASIYFGDAMNPFGPYALVEEWVVADACPRCVLVPEFCEIGFRV